MSQLHSLLNGQLLNDLLLLLVLLLLIVLLVLQLLLELVFDFWRILYYFGRRYKFAILNRITCSERAPICSKSFKLHLLVPTEYL